jgi:hypothetical protein
MPKPKATNGRDAGADRGGGVQLVPREYAGKWVAWSADGRRILAVGDTFQACERAAVRAGYAANQVAIDKIPAHRRRVDEEK